MADKKLRQERMASVIHAGVAEFFVEHNRDWGIDALPLVDQVFVSPDLHHVQVWVSFAPWRKDRVEGEFKVIVGHLGVIKRALGDKVELRRFPEIELKLSDPEKSFRIMDILDKINGHGATDQSHQGEADSAIQEDPTDSSH